MKTNKKILAILIAAVLVITLLPSMAFAEGEELCVGGVMVDLVKGSSGDGWSYDPVTETLALDNATITGVSDSVDFDDYREGTANIYSKNMNLNILLSGESSVSGAERAIVISKGNLTINGGGILTASSTKYPDINTPGELTISDCTVKAINRGIESGSLVIKNSEVTSQRIGGTSSAAIIARNGIIIENSIIYASGQTDGITTESITITNSSVEAKGDIGILAFSGITLNGVDITTPVGGIVNSYGGMYWIGDNSGGQKEHVKLEPDPTWHHIKGVTALQNGGDYMEGADPLPPGASEGEDVAVGIHLASAKVPPAKLYYKTADETETDIPFTVGGEKNDFVSGSFKMPASDVEVIAEWEAPTCTVKFETNGGTAVVDQTVKKGEKAAKPEDPSKDGYSFYNWFGDEACTAPFDFTQAIDGDTTVYAHWLKNISGFKIYTDGTEKGSDGYYNVKADVTEVLFEKDSADMKIEVKPLSKDPADYTDPNKLKEAPEYGKEYYFHVELTDVNGKPGRPTVIDNGKLKTGTVATAENATITLMDVAHSADETVITMVFKYVENEPEPEPEPEPDPEPDPEPEPAPVVKPVYWVSEGTDLTVSKDTAEGLKLTVHRKPDDDLTYGLFTGVEMGGKQLASSDFTAESGSLKLTVKPSYIKNLAAGSYKLTVKFSDGEATANVKVTEVSDNPKTGDESGLWLYVLIAVIAAGGIIAALLVYRKQSKRE